jgi:hypothetical protein
MGAPAQRGVSQVKSAADHNALTRPVDRARHRHTLGSPALLKGAGGQASLRRLLAMWGGGFSLANTPSPGLRDGPDP